jgi:hypothetical protein
LAGGSMMRWWERKVSMAATANLTNGCASGIHGLEAISFERSARIGPKG